MTRAVWFVLLAAACNAAPASPQVKAVCSLTELPHATPQQQAAVRSQARGRLTDLDAIRGSKAEKAIVKALLEVATSGAAAPSDLPSPAASSLVVDGRAYGLPTLDEALGHLRKACA